MRVIPSPSVSLPIQIVGWVVFGMLKTKSEVDVPRYDGWHSRNDDFIFVVGAGRCPSYTELGVREHKFCPRTRSLLRASRRTYSCPAPSDTNQGQDQCQYYRTLPGLVTRWIFSRERHQPWLYLVCAQVGCNFCSGFDVRGNKKVMAFRKTNVCQHIITVSPGVAIAHTSLIAIPFLSA